MIIDFEHIDSSEEYLSYLTNIALEEQWQEELLNLLKENSYGEEEINNCSKQ